ncbi:major facilitator superfamily transporter [Stemphylium lycopersici]|nr:major facilitator superfamily transporter [Stemphylium lycopersici]
MPFNSFDDAYRAAVKPGPDRLLSGVALGAAGALGKGLPSGRDDFFATYGTLELDPTSPSVSTKTTFWIASCTKLVTAIAALQCVERDLFTLDDAADIDRLLPEWRQPDMLTGWTDDQTPILQPAKEKITLRKLLTHTSGIGYDFLSPELMKWRKSRGEGIVSLQAPITESFGTPLLFEPGSGFAYGGGLDLAGLMVARANKSTLEAYMRQNIFDVLGMDSTSFHAKHNDIERLLMPMTTRPAPGAALVSGYGPDEPLKALLEPADEFGGAGLFSNTEDYLKLLKSVLRDDGKLLKSESIDLMFAPSISPWAQASLNTTLSVPPYAAIMIPGEGLPGTSGARAWTHALGGLVALEDDSRGGLKAGALQWGGAPNLKWWIDRKGGTCGVFSTQLFPAGELQHAFLGKLFQREVQAIEPEDEISPYAVGPLFFRAPARKLEDTDWRRGRLMHGDAAGPIPWLTQQILAMTYHACHLRRQTAPPTAQSAPRLPLTACTVSAIQGLLKHDAPYEDCKYSRHHPAPPKPNFSLTLERHQQPRRNFRRGKTAANMQEEDYEILRNEANASPDRYSTWDPNREFAERYHRRHQHDQSHEERMRNIEAHERGDRTQSELSFPREQVTSPVREKEEEVASPLSRHSTSSASTVSSASSSSTHSARLEEIRTARSTPARDRRPTLNSQASSGNYLTLHPTERNPEAIRRIETHRSQHAGTVGASRVDSRLSRTLTRRRTEKPLPNLGAGKPFPPLLPDREEYVVEFDGVDDPLHAQNWPMKKKLGIGAMLAFDALSATMGSSIFSAATGPVSQQFGVANVVGTLGTSLFVFGYAFGPLMWAPMSELYGRKPPLIIAAFGFAIFSIAVAVAKDLQTVLICRFFAGLFGSSPLAIVAAVFADMFDNKLRGLAVAVFSATVFMGPLLAPFIGGFITESYLGWRWTEYISSFMGFLAFALMFFFMEETYPPVVLINKASELRRRTKNWGIHAKQEEIEVDFKELLVKNVSRPMRILFTEPIVLLITIYMSFIYGLLYLFLTAYALVFQGVYGWSGGVGGLAYFGMVAGEVIAFIIVVCDNPRYIRKLEANNNIPVPEWRLPIAMVGGVLFAAGLFWFGWSGYTGQIHWIVPVLSGLFTGFGIFSIFLSLLNYIVDAYLMFAASAIAANTFMRSMFGGVFPLFATFMFNGMGIQWASTLLGCVAAVLVPMPVIFYLYGKRIRGRSSFAPAPDIAQDKRRDEESKGVQGNGDGGSGETTERESMNGDTGGMQKERSKEQ